MLHYETHFLYDSGPDVPCALMVIGHNEVINHINCTVSKFLFDFRRNAILFRQHNIWFESFHIFI